jgi:hypothetical protein
VTAPGLPPLGAGPSWAGAEQVAGRHRDARLDPHRSPRRHDAIFRPAVFIVWISAVVLALIGLITPGDRGYIFGFASYGALALFAVVGGWWLKSSGRYILRGSSASIRAAIPATARKSVRRQLALREPLDREHADVVLELAHQGRDLIGGQIALYAFYVPLYINIARNSREWIGIVILAIGTVVLLIGAVLLAVTGKRLATLVRTHPDGTAPTGRATTPA